MAKKSSIEKNNRRKRMTKNAAPKRAKLKAIIADKKKPMEERFAATLKLAVPVPATSHVAATLRSHAGASAAHTRVLHPAAPVAPQYSKMVSVNGPPGSADAPANPSLSTPTT